jgi:hypothetical protein
MQQIFPINATVLAYGPTSAVNKVRTVFTKFLKEDRSDLSKAEIEALISAVDSAEIAQAVADQRFDNDAALPKGGGKKLGLRMQLPELTERFLTMELLDLPFAQAATCLLQWDSRNDQQQHQVLWVAGAMQQTERPLG